MHFFHSFRERNNVKEQYKGHRRVFFQQYLTWTVHSFYMKWAEHLIQGTYAPVTLNATVCQFVNRVNSNFTESQKLFKIYEDPNCIHDSLFFNNREKLFKIHLESLNVLAKSWITPTNKPHVVYIHKKAPHCLLMPRYVCCVSHVAFCK